MGLLYIITFIMLCSSLVQHGLFWISIPMLIVSLVLNYAEKAETRKQISDNAKNGTSYDEDDWRWKERD